jgi:hypothetical protein
VLGEQRQQVPNTRIQGTEQPEGMAFLRLVGRATEARFQVGREEKQAVPKLGCQAADLSTEDHVVLAQLCHADGFLRQGEESRITELCKPPAWPFHGFGVAIEGVYEPIQCPADPAGPLALAVDQGPVKTPAQLSHRKFQGLFARLLHGCLALARCATFFQPFYYRSGASFTCLIRQKEMLNSTRSKADAEAGSLPQERCSCIRFGPFFIQLNTSKPTEHS